MQASERCKQAIFRAIAEVDHAMRRGVNAQVAFLEIRNFLVLQYESALGSVVHATPLYEALKSAMPDAHVTVAASSMAASVLQHSPYVDRCVVTPPPLHDMPRAARAVRELLRATPPGPRCILTTIGNRRPRIALLAVSAGRALRVGHTAAPAFYDLPLVFAPERGQIEGNLDVLRALGHPVAFCGPRVCFASRDAEHATQLLSALSDRPNTPRVALVTQNSRGQRNQWPTERLRQVIADLAQTCDAIPLFIGTSAESGSIEELRRDLPDPGLSLAGKTTVAELAAVLAQCDLVVSLDTGPFHVARAVGLPGVVIAPAWQDPREWLPVDDPSYRVLRGPAISSAPPDYRIEEVSVSQVTQAARELLQRFPASGQARTGRLQNAMHT